MENSVKLECTVMSGAGRLGDYTIEIGTSSSHRALLLLENYYLVRYVVRRMHLKEFGSKLQDLSQGPVPPEEITIRTEALRHKYVHLVGSRYYYISPMHRYQKMFSDVLAFAEFYLNRYTSFNDETMKTYMLQVRYMLAELLDYRVPAGSFKSDLLTFKPKEMSSIICIESDILSDESRKPKEFPEGNKDLYYNQFRKSADGPRRYAISAFLAELTSDNGEEVCDMDICVPLKDIPDELRPLFGNREYMPLEKLVDLLFNEYSDPGFPKPLRYLVDRDILDMSSDHICALDPFIGTVGPRDRDFESSDSSLSLISAWNSDLVRDVALYSRILHSVIMGSYLEDNSISLAFRPDLLLRLVDTYMVNRNYPPMVVFSPHARGPMERYICSLGNEYEFEEQDEDGHPVLVSDRIMNINRTNRGSGGCLALSSPGKVGNSTVLFDYADSTTPVRFYHVGEDTDRAISLLAKVLTTRNINNQIITVCTPEDMYFMDRLIIGMGDIRECVHYCLVLGESSYVTIRRDLYDLLEIGIPRNNEGMMWSIHSNCREDRRRLVSKNVSEMLKKADTSGHPLWSYLVTRFRYLNEHGFSPETP